jgi:hypothetical protein
MPKAHLAASTRQNYLTTDARMLMEAVAFYADPISSYDGGRRARDVLRQMRIYGVCPECRNAFALNPKGLVRGHDRYDRPTNPNHLRARMWPPGCRGSQLPPFQPREPEPTPVQKEHTDDDNRSVSEIRFSLLELD